MKHIPEVVMYVTFDISQIPPEITRSDDLKTYVLLQTQGESVELIESPRIALSMFIFNIIHSVCPEVVFRTNSGGRHIIYDHQPETVIHPVGVNEALSVKQDFTSHETPQNNVEINLEEIWNSISDEKEDAKILRSLEKVKGEIRKTGKTTIIGDVPLLLILCAQHLVGHNSRQIFYKRNLSKEAKRIK